MNHMDILLQIKNRDIILQINLYKSKETQSINVKECKIRYSLGPRGVYLALASIQCFIVVSIASESPDSKSAGCKAVTLGKKS